jgi:CRP/FNR family transcriptional regulator, cyclic AMP receptor protein
MKEFAYIHEHGHVPDALRTLPFLGSFDDEQLDDVLDSSNYVQCEPGDVMIDEGAIDSRIYILLRGEVEVRRGGKVLATIGRAGEVFGELAVVNEDRRSASVVAKTAVVCLAVDQKFLQDIKPREEYPAFYAALYEFIARLTAARLDATSRKLAQVQNELRRLKEKMVAKRGPARPVKRVKAVAVKRKAPLRRRR